MMATSRWCSFSAYRENVQNHDKGLAMTKRATGLIFGFFFSGAFFRGKGQVTLWVKGRVGRGKLVDVMIRSNGANSPLSMRCHTAP
jgi:hypothetical protein